MSSVCGNVALRFRQYTKDKLPQLRIVFSLMTLDGSRNHILWNQDYAAPTRAALRNMATAGLRAMAANGEYPTAPAAQIHQAIAQPQLNQVWTAPVLLIAHHPTDGD